MHEKLISICLRHIKKITTKTSQIMFLNILTSSATFQNTLLFLVCLYLHEGNTESRKNSQQKYILAPHRISQLFSAKALFALR